MKPRAVFDCMIFLQGATRKTSAAAACFRLVDCGVLELYLSSDVLAEVKGVLARPNLRRKFQALEPKNVKSFMGNVESKAVVVADVPKVIPLERDPKDEPYLNLALAAQVSYLVTRDKDLLDLMNDESFRQR